MCRPQPGQMGPAPARCGHVYPREGQAPGRHPCPPLAAARRCGLCVPLFVYESSGSKVSCTQCIRPGAVTAMSGTLLTLQGFNQ